MNVFTHSLISARRTAAGFCLLMTLVLWFCSPASAQTITAELTKVITPDGFDAMTIIPEGQSATLTVVIQPAPSANVTVRLSVAEADRRQVTLTPAELTLSSESTQAQASVHVINDDTPEDQQTIDIVLTPEDSSITVQAAPTFTIPQSYSNTAFCEALNTVNCPVFFTLPDSHAPWRRTAEIPSIVGPTALRSGNISHNQRSCLSFIAQQPTRILFDWRVSSQHNRDGILYIDGNNRRARLPSFRQASLVNARKSLTGIGGGWVSSKFDYSGDGLLMLEWCYEKSRANSAGEDAGFLDNLQIIPSGSVQARLFPTRIPEPGRADLALFHNLEQDTTVKLAFVAGTPENARIDPKELKLKSAESRTIAALTIEDDGDLQEEERSGTLTMALSPDSQAIMLSNTDFAFTISQDAPVTAELPKLITPDGFDAMTIIPEGQSATLTLTVALQLPPATNVAVRLSVTPADPPQVTLSANKVILSQESSQIPVIVHVINDNVAEDLQTVDIVLTAEDENLPVREDGTTFTITIPQSYSNTEFCEALNTVNCPAFFTLPDSHATWRTAEIPSNIGPTALRSGNISHDQRSCLSFITQQPTRILFDWRVSSENNFDGIFYIDENDRNARFEDIGDILSNTAKFLTGEGEWISSKFDYSGDGLLMLEWCYAKDSGDDFSVGKDAGFLDNLQIIPPGSVQARLFPTSIREADSADLVLFHNLEQDTTVKLAFADGTPKNALIDPKELKLKSAESSTIAALAIEDNGIPQGERSGTLTIALSPDNQAVMLSSTDFAFTIPQDVPVTAELPKLITPDGFDDMIIIPEGQSATLTVAFHPSFATPVTVRLSVTQPDPPQVTLSATRLVLSPESNQVPVIVHAINDDIPEDLQTIVIVLTSEDENLPVQEDGTTFTITIPQSYSNTAFCEALNTINCPVFFTLPGSDAAWRTAEIPATIGPTALRSGNIGLSQRSCLSFITQQPTRILFDWRVSSEDESDGIFYIDENDRRQRLAKVGNLSNTAKLLTGNIAWMNRKFDYSGDGLLMLEWCYATDAHNNFRENAGFLDNLQIVPLGSVQARLLPTRIPESDSADLALFYNLEQDTTVKLAFADGTPENARIDRLRSKELKLKNAESRTIAALIMEDDGILQEEERSGTLTMALSPDNQAVMLSNTAFAFTIPKDIPMITAELPKIITPDGFDAMTIMPEGQSATLTVAFRSSFATNVTVRLSVTPADPPQVTLSADKVILSPESNQVPVIVHAINDNVPEDLQTIVIALTSEDENLPVQEDASAFTITIPQSYSNVAFCEALNTINCPVFFTLPDSHAPWRIDQNTLEGRTALRSGNIGDNQRSCLSFVTQQPTRILFDWRVSSENNFDGIFYIDENDRNARFEDIGHELNNTPKLLTEPERGWLSSKFDYSGDGLLLLEWCYAKNRRVSRGEDAGFLDNLKIIPSGSVQARLFPTRIPELGRADLVLLHHLEQDTTVKLAFAEGTPENARIDRLRSKELKLRSAEGRTIAALTVEDDGILQQERSGTLTIALSPDNQAVMLSNANLAFTITKDMPMITAELLKPITPDGFDAMTIIPEGQSAMLTATFQPSFATNVAVRLNVTPDDPPQITLSTTQLVLNPESNQLPVIVHAINDNVPEDLQTIVIVLTSEDESVPVQEDASTFTITIPQSYSNAAFCEALNTIGNCPAFFTLPDSHAPWRIDRMHPDTGRTALRSGNISDNQRSCLSFIAQQPTRILFDWRVSSDAGNDGILYIDENDRRQRLAKVGNLSNTAKSLTGTVGGWLSRKFDYSGDGPLMLEWCYAKDDSNSGGEDAGFLDNLTTSANRFLLRVKVYLEGAL